MSFDFSKDPLENFLSELEGAKALSQGDSPLIPEPTAMQLATVSKAGGVSSRTVLFKGLYGDKLSFFTNYGSRKARDLSENPNCALIFYWGPLRTQIRFQGLAEKMSRPDSEEYFASRPRLSQIGAWVSRQSSELSSFASFQEEVQSFDQSQRGRDILCPPHWGGYLIKPLLVEFWYEKLGRLHERYVYERSEDQALWKRYFKYP